MELGIMGLNIMTSDNHMDFYISYFGFTNMRAFFILHYSESLYHHYKREVNNACRLLFDEETKDEPHNYALIGDLSILIDHSDCDGELTSNECKLLKNSLFVDEDKIKTVYSGNLEYANRMIKLMYEFISLVNYCADNDAVKLIFG